MYIDVDIFICIYTHIYIYISKKYKSEKLINTE